MPSKEQSSQNPGPKESGASKGDSPLLNYGDAGPAKPPIGFSDALPQTEERERIYRELFGESNSVFHELLPLTPHIDVYCFPPNKERDFYTFVTGGVSDRPMNAPRELGREYRRIELVFYAADGDKQYAEFLRRLGHFAHDNNTWLHWGHTIPNGDPPSPFFGDGPLNTVFFMPSIVEPDSQLGQRLAIEADPVNLLWCVPITAAECQLILDQGPDAIFDLFSVNNHPFVFGGQRESYTKTK